MKKLGINILFSFFALFSKAQKSNHTTVFVQTNNFYFNNFFTIVDTIDSKINAIYYGAELGKNNELVYYKSYFTFAKLEEDVSFVLYDYDLTWAPNFTWLHKKIKNEMEQKRPISLTYPMHFWGKSKGDTITLQRTCLYCGIMADQFVFYKQ